MRNRKPSSCNPEKDIQNKKKKLSQKEWEGALQMQEGYDKVLEKDRNIENKQIKSNTAPAKRLPSKRRESRRVIEKINHARAGSWLNG